MKRRRVRQSAVGSLMRGGERGRASEVGITGSAKRGQREGGSVFPEGAHVIRGRPFRSATQQDSGDRAREDQVSHLRDDRYGGEPRIDFGAEGPVPLPGLDGASKPFEKAG